VTLVLPLAMFERGLDNLTIGFLTATSVVRQATCAAILANYIFGDHFHYGECGRTCPAHLCTYVTYRVYIGHLTFCVVIGMQISLWSPGAQGLERSWPLCLRLASENHLIEIPGWASAQQKHRLIVHPFGDV